MSVVKSENTATRNASRNRLVRETQRKLKEPVTKFLKACVQLSFIEKHLIDLSRGFEAAKRDGNQCFLYNMRINMWTLECVLSILSEYVFMRVEDIIMLRHDVRILMRHKIVESDEEYEGEGD
ncbi:hypothetical protein DPMN_127788 [Dreissena polymorpha]|uniref:Uncharacterized protein n=1 Tax=Dreissena polymorpha TaxID=45954 RepID=A0A9D4JZH9_DREPO|nr:hypothetical protein DPMN_127788 [Dreissena polymorpha]